MGFLLNLFVSYLSNHWNDDHELYHVQTVCNYCNYVNVSMFTVMLHMFIFGQFVPRRHVRFAIYIAR
jgi:ubiquinone biosynthesis protein Coq4